MKKKKKRKVRNVLVIAMLKRCKGGPMKNKKDKRKNGTNEQQAFLEEEY